MITKEFTFTHGGDEYIAVVQISPRKFADATNHPVKGAKVNNTRVFNISHFRRVHSRTQPV